MSFANNDNAKGVIGAALDALGKKNVVLIAHANSFPASQTSDTGMGNTNSQPARDFMEFLSGIFNAIQLGPAGKTKACDSSPYTSTIFSNNPLFIDLEQLTTDAWGKILPLGEFDRIVSENPKSGEGSTAYSYIYEHQTEALKLAYKNFIDFDLDVLKKEFEAYKQANATWLERDALYEALSVHYDNDYWKNWTDELDKKLYNPKGEFEAEQCAQRIDELMSEYADVIDCYCFVQFVISKQNKHTKVFADYKGLKMIADRQVAFSDRDIWAYCSIFLDGWLLGCPPDYFSKNGQAWGFPVVNPEKLFNETGELGEAGLLLKQLYLKLFTENTGGVRIDHIVGLIDPWVYKKGSTPKPEDGAGRLFSSPEHEELSKYAIAKLDDLDTGLESDKEHRVKTLDDNQIKCYGAFMERIVLAAADEAGVDRALIVCEDLGTLTNPVAAVMKYYELRGMCVTQFVDPTMLEHPYRHRNMPKTCWCMLGTHDNEPILCWAKKHIHSELGNMHSENLVVDMFGEFPEQTRNDIGHNLRTDYKYLAFMKFVEIFSSDSENVQVFFTDFFGLEQTYNTPGTSGDENWSLRVPNDFIEAYNQKLGAGLALNLAKVLKTAMETKGGEFIKEHKDLISKLEQLI